MTALVARGPLAGLGDGHAGGRRVARIAGMLGLLAVAVEARRLAVLGGGDGLAVGAAFGVALVVVALAGGWRPRQPRVRALAVGLAAGIGAACALVALALIGRARGPWIPLDPAPALLPWVQVTVLVAAAEELVLRGALFDELEGAGGTAVAVAVTAVAFALLHVPLYGWAVVPLDLGVGVLLGGLRVATGGVLAPATAHVVADLAAWWL